MRLVSVIVLIALTGCAATPQLGKFEYANTKIDVVVWPMRPDIPRYRYVGELTGEENYPVEKKDRSFLARLVGLFENTIKPKILQRPHNGYTTASGVTYVADTSRQAIFEFNPKAGRVAIWEYAAPDLKFQSPVAIAEMVDGSILVTDADLAQVSRFSAEGEYVETLINSSLLTRPTGIAVNAANDSIYVSDTADHVIKVFTLEGIYKHTIGSRGEEGGMFNYPTYLHLNGDKLFVTDAMNARVQVLALDGSYINEIGARGSRVGDTPRPKGVTTDSEGNIYIVESYYDHLLIFNQNRQFLLPIGGTGKEIGQFYLPAGVWADNNDRIYVADMFNGRIFIVQYLGGE